MSFILAKLAWLVLQPSNLFFFALAAAMLLGWRRLVAGVGSILALVALLPIGLWLTQPLEDRFPRPAAPPERVTGIIVLGGGQEPHITESRGIVALNQGGERLLEGLALARRHPEARLVFSGRSGRPGDRGASEQLVNAAFVRLMDFDATRVTYEDRSRNTWENARYTKELVEPGPDDIWLLVTSASHMPRAVGIFRTIDFRVTAWPVDYQTTTAFAWPPRFSVADRLRELDYAAREWLALAAYHFQNRTDALFPAP